MREEWRTLAAYPDYEVSNYGEIYSHKTDRILEGRDSGHGFIRVHLTNEDGTREEYIHQMVASAFVRGWRPRTQVMHFDGDKSNNRVDNLRVRSRRFYPEDVRIRHYRGQSVRIVETGEIFRSIRDCARKIGGDYSTIYQCLKGKRKTHLGFTYEFYKE